MSTPLRPGQMPARSVAETKLMHGATAVRFVAAVVALGTTVSALMLASATDSDPSGFTQRPYVGHGIAIASLGIGLCAILLFVAAWADRWTDAQYTQRIQREQHDSRIR